MRDLRPGKTGPARREIPPIEAKRRYLAARAKSETPHQRNLSLIRQYEANPNPPMKRPGLGTIARGVDAIVGAGIGVRPSRIPGNVATNAERLIPGSGEWNAAHQLRSHRDAAGEPNVGIAFPGGGVVRGLATAGAGLVGAYKYVTWGGPGSSRADNKTNHDHKQFLNEQASTRGGYNEDVEYLLRTKQIQPSQAQKAHSWAMTAGPAELRARRGFLRQKYNVPARYRYSGQYLTP